MVDMQDERTTVQVIVALAATETWHPFSGTHDCIGKLWQQGRRSEPNSCCNNEKRNRHCLLNVLSIVVYYVRCQLFLDYKWDLTDGLGRGVLSW